MWTTHANDTTNLHEVWRQQKPSEYSFLQTNNIQQYYVMKMEQTNQVKLSIISFSLDFFLQCQKSNECPATVHKIQSGVAW